MIPGDRRCHGPPLLFPFVGSCSFLISSPSGEPNNKAGRTERKSWKMVCILFPAALLALVPLVAAERRLPTTRGTSFIRAPVNALAGPGPKVRVRQNEVEIESQLTGTRYAVDIELGTPPQQLKLILDTGSPDTWVNPSCENVNDAAECDLYPHFDYRESSTFTLTRDGDILVYGIGNATIRYAFETLTIGCKFCPLRSPPPAPLRTWGVALR